MLFHTHTIYLGQGADGEGRPGLGDALARALTYAPRASPAGTYGTMGCIGGQVKCDVGGLSVPAALGHRFMSTITRPNR